MSDVLDQLDTLTRQGEDYIWRPARAAVAEISRLRAVNAALVAALEDLHSDCVEYCRINHLHNNDGGPATNHAMRRAAEAIALAKGEKT